MENQTPSTTVENTQRRQPNSQSLSARLRRVFPTRWNGSGQNRVNTNSPVDDSTIMTQSPETSPGAPGISRSSYRRNAVQSFRSVMWRSGRVGAEQEAPTTARPVQDASPEESDVENGTGLPKAQRRSKLFWISCFPGHYTPRMRTHVMRCCISGILLLLLLATYLALSITKSIRSNEFTVLLILLILFLTIIFCHSLVRLCMYLIKGEDGGSENAGPDQLLSGGYVMPERPIRVLLARDEENAGIDSVTNHVKPPAYGLWRESMRVDPNRLFWQRNEEATRDEANTPTERSTLSRPPSYTSDDGIAYVVEATPRSTVPVETTASSLTRISGVGGPPELRR